MSAYLYALIPYKSGIDFTYSDEPFYWHPLIREFENVDSELTDREGLQQYGDYIVVNTCARMSSLKCDTRGFCWIRSEVYKLAKAVGAEEVWYIEELSFEHIEDMNITLEEFKEMLRGPYSYCTKEVNLDMLKDNSYASFCHDDFSDIVVNREERKRR